MGAWVENRFEDSANRLLRGVILREQRHPEPFDDLAEEMRAAEWVYRYLGGLGIVGGPAEMMLTYMKDCMKLRDDVAAALPNGPAKEGT